MNRAAFVLLGVVLGAGCGGGDDGGQKDAVMKFCNLLSLGNGMDVKLALEYGSPPVRIDISGVNCSPAPSQKCVAVPSGKLTPVVVRRDGNILASMVLDVDPGDQLIFLATALLDDENRPVPVLEGGALRPEFSCDTLNPLADAPAPPTGGGPSPRP